MQDQGDYIWPLEQLHWALISQHLNQQLQLSYMNSLAQLTTPETLLHATKNVWEWTGMKWDVLRYDRNIPLVMKRTAMKKEKRKKAFTPV